MPRRNRRTRRRRRDVTEPTSTETRPNYAEMANDIVRRGLATHAILGPRPPGRDPERRPDNDEGTAA